MKKVAFAWVTEWVDFSDREEALIYARREREKGHRIMDSENMYAFTAQEIENAVYENNNDDFKYTVRVEKPYRNYNMG